MLPEVSPDNGVAAAGAPAAAAARSAWWVRVLACIPLRVLYGCAAFLGWLTYRLFPYRERSEEHTSELQSQSNLVCRLLLEKKKIVPHERSTNIRLDAEPTSVTLA